MCFNNIILFNVLNDGPYQGLWPIPTIW